MAGFLTTGLAIGFGFGGLTIGLTTSLGVGFGVGFGTGSFTTGALTTGLIVVITFGAGFAVGLIEPFWAVITNWFLSVKTSTQVFCVHAAVAAGAPNKSKITINGYRLISIPHLPHHLGT